MSHLREQLGHCFQGRVCLLGLGSVDYGDDGFGVRLVEALKSPSSRVNRLQCLIGGTAPERWIGWAIAGGCDHLIFVDAVDFGAAPGSAILLNSEQMSARHPQVSTHKVSLGLLAKWAEGNGRTKAWLLGVQPESLKPGALLSPAVQATLEALLGLLQELALEVAA